MGYSLGKKRVGMEFPHLYSLKDSTSLLKFTQ